MDRKIAPALRQHLIEALERRAAMHDGDVRRLLDERLQALKQADSAEAGDDAVVTVQRPRSALADLLGALPGNEAYPMLPALDEFQRRWSQLRAESQWRHSLEHTAENAGPLNSSALVHRAIALMRDTSPDYLRHFLSYLDDLSWLEGLADRKAASIDTGAPTPASIGKRRKSKPRTRG